MGSVQAGELKENSAVKDITLELDEDNSILVIPTESDKIEILTSEFTEKPASAILSGTIDENNQVTLEGTIVLDGKKEKVKLYGEATQVFAGWDIPDGAKPINITVGNDETGYATITRYEGATEKLATVVDLQDKSGKFNVSGKFYDDGHGLLFGTVQLEGKECNIALLGNSMSLYSSVTPSITTKSEYLTVEHRSQWELLTEGYTYSEASTACACAASAMLEEYYTSVSPTIGSIYDIYGSMNAYDVEEYLQDQDIDVDRREHYGTLSSVINAGVYYIDTDRPFYTSEESPYGNPHAIIISGYSDSSDYFKYEDPLKLSSSSTMYWYEADASSFNFEENVYEHVGGSDDMDDGMVVVV